MIRSIGRFDALGQGGWHVTAKNDGAVILAQIITEGPTVTQPTYAAVEVRVDGDETILITIHGRSANARLLSRWVALRDHVYTNATSVEELSLLLGEMRDALDKHIASSAEVSP